MIDWGYVDLALFLATAIFGIASTRLGDSCTRAFLLVDNAP